MALRLEEGKDDFNENIWLFEEGKKKKKVKYENKWYKRKN
jgi:hypothetical protein